MAAKRTILSQAGAIMPIFQPRPLPPPPPPKPLTGMTGPLPGY
jgi:hypothetical protein